MKSYVIALAALTTGCTHVATYRSQDLAATADDQAVRGVSYAMPAVQYEIVVMRTLENCDVPGDPKIAVTAEASSRIVPGERYELDPSSLSSIFKVSSVGVEFYDDLGTLKAFNAAADDKTGDILVDLVKVGVGVASAGAGNAGLAVAAAAKAVTTEQAYAKVLKSGELQGLLEGFGQAGAASAAKVGCSALARTRLATLDVETGKLKAATAELGRLNRAVDRQKILASYKGFDATAMKGLIALVVKQQAASEAMDSANKAVGKALAKLQTKSTFRWPRITSARTPVRFPIGEVPFDPNPDEEAAICENLVVTGQPAGDRCRFAQAAFGTLTATRVRLVLEADQIHATKGIPALTRAINTKGANKGVLVREPARGMLVVERATTEASKFDGDNWERVLTGDPQWISQLGTVRFLPFASGPFENEALSLSLRKDGRIETVKYESKDSALARAAAAAAKASKEIADASESRETERRSDAEYASKQVAAARAEQIAVFDHDITILKKQAEKIAAGKTPSDAEQAAQVALAQAQADIAQKTAQRDQLKLQQEIDALRKQAAGL